MATDAEIVELGHLGPPPRLRPADRRGVLFYLPRAEAIMAVETRTEVGWRCRVVAQRHPDLDISHLDITDDEIAAAPTSITADPQADPDGYAMLVWQARVWQHWLGGTVHLGARTLANDIRRPGTLTVDLDRSAQRRLLAATHLRVVGVHRLLDRLVAADLLIPDLPGIDGGWGTFTLTLPARLLDGTGRS